MHEIKPCVLYIKILCNDIIHYTALNFILVSSTKRPLLLNLGLLNSLPFSKNTIASLVSEILAIENAELDDFNELAHKFIILYGDMFAQCTTKFEH